MFGILVECVQELSKGFLFCTKQAAEMQDNQHLAGDLSDEGTSGPSHAEAEHLESGTVNASVPTGGARPKVFSSFMRMTKSKSSHQGIKSTEQISNEGTAFESNCSPLTTSASFLSTHRPYSQDMNAASSTNLLASEYPCEQEPMERWKNAGIALRKALSSSTSCTLTTPISNCMSRSFRLSNQSSSNSRNGKKGSCHHIARKNILDTDSLAISDASAILSNIPVTSSPLLCKKHGSSVSESPLTGDIDIASTSQLELRGDYKVSAEVFTSPFNRLKRVDSFSKSENEIDVPEKCVLERSLEIFHLRSDDHDFLRTLDSKNANQSLHSSQTDLGFNQNCVGLVTNSNRTLENAASQVPNCTHADNLDSSQSQTYQMLECQLNNLISSNDKSVIEYSSSESDITDCSSLYEDDDVGHSRVKLLAAGVVREDWEPKKQKRKSQTTKKYRNGETACSSDSIQEGAKNCQRQKKKLKGGLAETLENSPKSGCLFMLDTPLSHHDWSHSSITDSDSETNTPSSHRRSRIRSGRTSRERKAAAVDPDKISKDFRWVSPVPRRHTSQASKHSTTKSIRDWTSTDSMSDSLLRGHRHLATYSSSSSLDKITGCDLDRTIPPLTWSIVDGLHSESDPYNRSQMSRGLLHNLHSNNQDQVVDYNQSQTWSLLDSLYSQSNENLSNLLSANAGRHGDQQKQDDSDPSSIAYDDVCCSCSGNKGSTSCRRSESHNGYHYKDCPNVDEFTWNKLDTQLTWDMWDLPPSESTLIDIPAVVGCHSESETHSGLDGDTDSADADDEFECDCIHCQQMRDVFSQRPNSQGNEPETAAAAAAAAATAIAASSSPLPLATSTASVLLNTGSSGSLSSDHNDWSTSLSEDNPLDINIAELNPLDLLLMRQDARRDMLELMFQNVILQMLAVHPDLLNDQAPPPAAQTVIENLHSIHTTQEDVDQDVSCPICLCSWELNEIMAQLPCQHIFHPLCVRAWLVKSGTCPVCRHVL